MNQFSARTFWFFLSFLFWQLQIHHCKAFPALTRQDIDDFDYEGADKTLEDDNEDQSGRFFGLFQNNKLKSFAQRCNDNARQCDETQNLYCSEQTIGLSRRCVPIGTSCLAAVADSFEKSSGYTVWKDTILAEARVSVEDLANARLSAGDFEAFQETPAYLSLLQAFQSNPPVSALRELQTAAANCTTPNQNFAAAVDGKAPSSDGMTTYLGLHLEAGFTVDAALSLFWAMDENATMASYSRGAFGAELGAGVEFAGLLGFAFTGTASDMVGDAVAFDSEFPTGILALGIGAGIAIIANLNGLTSLEFTFGPCLSASLLGISYAVTAACDPASTTAPNAAPTAAAAAVAAPTPVSIIP